MHFQLSNAMTGKWFKFVLKCMSSTHNKIYRINSPFNFHKYFTYTQSFNVNPVCCHRQKCSLLIATNCKEKRIIINVDVCVCGYAKHWNANQTCISFSCSWNEIFITSTPFTACHLKRRYDTKFVTQRNNSIEFFNRFTSLFSSFFALTTFCDKMSTMSVLFGVCYSLFFLHWAFSEKYQTKSKDYVLLTFTKWQIKKASIDSIKSNDYKKSQYTLQPR